jgi:hypothetical protein
MVNVKCSIGERVNRRTIAATRTTRATVTRAGVFI